MQIHKRLSVGQVKTILRGYSGGNLNASEALSLLGIKRSRFFTLLALYRQNPESFSFSYHRHTPRQLPLEAERKIKKCLKEDREIIVNPEIPNPLRLQIPGAASLPSGAYPICCFPKCF